MRNRVFPVLALMLAASCSSHDVSRVQGQEAAAEDDIHLALADVPSGDDGNAYQLYAAGPEGSRDVTFCLGTPAECARPGATRMAAETVNLQGRTAFRSSRPVAVRDGLVVTVSARDAEGGALSGTFRVIGRDARRDDGKSQDDRTDAQGTGKDEAKKDGQGEPDPNDPAVKAIALLNQMRAQQGLPPVTYDANLSARCEQWSKEMNRTGLHHDPRVYGTPERENIVGGAGFPLTFEYAMRAWHNSPGHAASMYDRGFPRADRAGYGQYQGFGCLRICPKQSSGSVCQ